MESEVWGPSAWTFLHTVTLNYQEEPTNEDIKQHKIFFETLGNILPCPKCREHYNQSIIDEPVKLDSKESLTKWLFDLHNKVNEKNNKKIIEYDNFINNYRRLYGTKEYTTRIFYILILIVLVLIFLVYRK